MGMELFSSMPCWAWHPARNEHEAGYTLFRRVVNCTLEAEYHIAVSGDNRFNFHLDGKLLGRGPLRSDPEHYYYDEYCGTLEPGRHLFAAEVIVWADAWRDSAAPWSEMHRGGGFFVAGYVGDERMELPGEWLVSIDLGRRPLAWKETWKRSNVNPAPPLDEINFSRFDSEWATTLAPDGEWVVPVSLRKAEFRDTYQTDPQTPWILEPRPLRQMAETFTPVGKILFGGETLRIENGRLAGRCPSGKHTVLIDLGRNQTSIVRFAGRGGCGTCRIAYSEALFNEKKERTHALPGHVGELGYSDRLIFPGGDKTWQYSSFWYRSGRFIELEFDLGEAVSEMSLEFAFITYPIENWKPFHAPDDPALEKMVEVACHTLRCCMHEHFEDCPYYEQMQYAGDSRIEALVLYAATGNSDFGRQALRMFSFSQTFDGIIQSRYPSTFRQIIPGYSLIWALMIHDHFQFFHDQALVRELLPHAENMLDAFERKRLDCGLIGPISGWHFTDWAKDWPDGASDRGENLPETIQSLFYAEACRRTGELKTAIGMDASELLRRAADTLNAIHANCFDPESKLYADVPGKKWFSVHANTLAVLFGAVPERERVAFLRRTLTDPDLTQPTMYFDFYILSAIREYGDYSEFRARLGVWEAMLNEGLTTFPETPSPWARSLCHAWSCSPAYFLYSPKKGGEQKQ